MPDAFAAASYRTFSSEAELATFAGIFARGLRAGDVVALSGPLGAGKTAFVRGAVRELQGRDPVSSPTFTFWHRYDGRPIVDHLDLFRIDDPEDLTELGLEDAFAGDSIVFVEWWGRAPGLLPERRYEIDIEGNGDAPRTLRISEPRP